MTRTPHSHHSSEFKEQALLKARHRGTRSVTVRGTAGHAADVTESHGLLHGQETAVFADAGYQGAEKRPDARPGVCWYVAMRPGKRKKLDKANSPVDALMEKIEKLKASIRAKVEQTR
jgi:IS5 family transposase